MPTSLGGHVMSSLYGHCFLYNDDSLFLSDKWPCHFILQLAVRREYLNLRFFHIKMSGSIEKVTTDRKKFGYA